MFNNNNYNEQKEFKIDFTSISTPTANDTSVPGVFTFLREPSNHSDITHDQQVYGLKPLTVVFDDDVSIDFGPGVHVILGPANTGKSALIKSITDKLVESELDYSSVQYMEPVFGSHILAQDACDEAFTKQFVFFDSLRAFTFMGGASLAGGISANIPLILTELTNYALSRNIVMFVTLNTIDLKMTDLLAAVSDGSATSVLQPHTIIGQDLTKVQISVRFNSRYYLRQTINFTTSFELDHDTVPLTKWDDPDAVIDPCIAKYCGDGFGPDSYTIVNENCEVTGAASNVVSRINVNK